MHNFLKGKTVYGRGKITGKCTVIKDYSKINSFKDDILIVPSLLPKHNKIYLKAKAIITEEGGALAHSSIFCREFKIPGVVGVRKATQIFKNEDKIEIDLDNSSVKRVG